MASASSPNAVSPSTRRTPFSTHVEIHITDGSWLGNGDPPAGFAPDFEPIAMAEVETHLRRLGQVHDHIVELTRDLGTLPGDGFPLSRLLRHMGASEAEYVRCSLDKPDDLRAAVKVMQADDDTLLDLAPGVVGAGQSTSSCCHSG